jgi:hypothetical protein
MELTVAEKSVVLKGNMLVDSLVELKEFEKAWCLAKWLVEMSVVSRGN